MVCQLINDRLEGVTWAGSVRGAEPWPGSVSLAGKVGVPGKGCSPQFGRGEVKHRVPGTHIQCFICSFPPPRNFCLFEMYFCCRFFCWDPQFRSALLSGSECLILHASRERRQVSGAPSGSTSVPYEPRICTWIHDDPS